MERYFKRKLSHSQSATGSSEARDDSSSSASNGGGEGEGLITQEQSITIALHRQPSIAGNDNFIRLCASIDACRFMLHQGLFFYGRHLTEDRSNRQNFLGTIKFIADQNESVRNAVLRNDPKSHQMVVMVAPHIEKDIANCFAQEIVQNILAELKDDFFSLMVDESIDVSGNEQMPVILRFVDSSGNVKERFICVVDMKEISSLSLKGAVDNLFDDLSLSLMKIRGQGYDGASNYNDEFSGLKTLIMNENGSAYYVHCFTHQLQSVVVAVASNHIDVACFFYMISTLMNVVGASCQHTDMIQQKKAEKVAEGFNSGSVKGFNQELGLKRYGDTYRGSHYRPLTHLIVSFSSVCDVLEVVSCDAKDSSIKAQARRVLTYLHSFDFVFNLQLMWTILGITNELSVALQMKEESILIAMSLVKVAKTRLQALRDDGWESLVGEISAFCTKNEIDCLDMGDEYVDMYHPRHKSNITNEFRYRVECFYTIIDKEILEMNDRFNEVNSELLLCVACLNPNDGFGNFNKKRLIKLAQFYPNDFSTFECMHLEYQLETYILDMQTDDRFSELKGLVDLSRLLVETRKHLCYPIVYRLLKLALILPIATPSVKRCFYATDFIKTELQDLICDQFVNDCLVCFIEKELLSNITNDVVMKRFHSMKTRGE